MEYEYKESIKEMIESYVISESEELKMKAELDHVYGQAAKADEYKDELRKQQGILSGQMDVMEINLNYYKRQATEYEAKARAFDRIVEQRKDTGVITLGHYAWHIIREYESGDRHV